MTLLEIKNVNKEYKTGHKALNNVSLSIDEGEFVVIIGPSGAGKSTLIRVINQLAAPTSGEVLFENQSISQAKGKELRKLRSHIGMIFQHYNLVERTNVLKNVLHGKLGQVSFFTSAFGRYSQEDRKTAMDLLKQVGLEDQAYKRADELSGGQMQRVGICRALMQHPALILADEPIASLDPKSSEVVMSQLKDITESKGVTTIVNLHQVDVAKKCATRIIGVRKGEIVFDGKPEELTTDMIETIYNNEQPQSDKITSIPVVPITQEGQVYG
ncbi:phosphonate ABC transporter ATP-binding protein [Vagococcus sp. JNUCC 83]